MGASWDRLGASEQQRAQSAELKRWLPTVTSYSRFWSEWFSRAAIDPGSIGSVDALATVPSVREVDLRGRGGEGSPQLVLRPSEDDLKASADFRTLWRVTSSVFRSGPTGKRRAILVDYKPIHLHPAGRDGGLTIAYSRTDLDRLHRTGARAAEITGLDGSDYLVSAIPADGGLGFWGTYHLALGASMLAVHSRGLGEGVEGVAAAFARVPGSAVAVPVAEAEDLAVALRDSGADIAQVHTVLTYGPPPDEDLRAVITDTWRAAGASAGVRVLAVWAPNSARAPWAECAPGSGLHAYPDLDVVEVLGPGGARVQGGGDLTITSLGWNGSALVRYQTGDHVAGVETGPCPSCGRTVPRVLSPVTPAAWEPVLETGQGPVRADLRGVARVVRNTPAITAWRVEIRSVRGGDRYRLFIAHAESWSGLDELAPRLARAVGVEPEEVIVADRAEIESHVRALGGVFEDRR